MSCIASRIACRSVHGCNFSTIWIHCHGTVAAAPCWDFAGATAILSQSKPITHAFSPNTHHRLNPLTNYLSHYLSHGPSHESTSTTVLLPPPEAWRSQSRQLR